MNPHNRQGQGPLLPIGRDILWPLCLLVFGFVLITLHQSDYFRTVPGDMGDARFNNMVLEHLYRWFVGKDPSLWSPGFFYPYPGALTFSDNHFGTGAVYIIMRLIGLDPEGAFVGWYTVAAPLNYLSCYYVLRRAGLGVRGSAVGAFVYTFAFNVSARHGHAQLAYRFAIPLAMLGWQRLIEDGRAKHVAWIAFWLTVQFYCSIYLGYFLLLMLIAYGVVQASLRPSTGQRKSYRALLDAAHDMFAGRRWGSMAGIVACCAALLVLFLPYLHYSSKYQIGRVYGDIEPLLPRLSSYLLVDGSMLWGNLSGHINGIPMRWEHQMFFGTAAYILAVIGLVRRPSHRNLSALLVLLVLIVLTLDVQGHSVYQAIYRLPLASAIRAIGRIGLVMVFPLAVLAGSGFDALFSAAHRRVLALCAGSLLLALMLVEYAAYYTQSVPLHDLRERVAALVAKAPRDLAKDAIIYIPPYQGQLAYQNELDGVRLSYALDRVTLNGYSGYVPRGFNDPGIDACAVVNNRLAGYAAFVGANYETYANLVRRVVVVGQPDGCRPSALAIRTHYHGKLPDSIAKGIALSIDQVSVVNGALSVRFVIANHSSEALPSLSDDNNPVRISWRFVAVGSERPDYDGWDTRKDVAADVPGEGSASIDAILTGLPDKPGRYRIEANLVQENMFWFHSIGMPIAKASQVVEIQPDRSVTIDASGE